MDDETAESMRKLVEKLIEELKDAKAKLREAQVEIELLRKMIV